MHQDSPFPSSRRRLGSGKIFRMDSAGDANEASLRADARALSLLRPLTSVKYSKSISGYLQRDTAELGMCVAYNAHRRGLLYFTETCLSFPAETPQGVTLSHRGETRWERRRERKEGENSNARQRDEGTRARMEVDSFSRQDIYILS